jgi:hypothetical protein
MTLPDEQAIAEMAAALGTTPEKIQAALAQPVVSGGHLETLMRVQERAQQAFGPPTGNRHQRRAMRAQRKRR